MAAISFSKEALNFFKFASIVHDEFPKMLRLTFETLWNSKVAPDYQVWDDTRAVRKLFKTLEGGKTAIPTNKSYEDWDCTALFKATIFSQAFANINTLYDQFIKGKKTGAFHTLPTIQTGNQDETLTLAIDRVRQLRNELCHLPNCTIEKCVFDYYVQLAKEAFTAVGFSTNQIDYIGSLEQSDFPIERVDELNEEIKSIKQEYRNFLEEKVMTTMTDECEIQKLFRECVLQELHEIKNVVNKQTTRNNR